jgi:triacylglycerol lipase
MVRRVDDNRPSASHDGDIARFSSRRPLGRRAHLALLLLAALVVGFALTLAVQTHRAQDAVPPPASFRLSTAVTAPGRCDPKVRHHDPVVLVHGTFAASAWDVMAPALTQRGYCVFVLDYGAAGTLDVVQSAHQIGQAVDRILALTHAQHVAIVGHSEGGLIPRYFIKYLGGAGKVSDLVGLAPSNHGTTNVLSLVGAANGCTACGQQFAWGSTFLQRLNASDEAPPPVDYTVIETSLDAVVTPYTSAFLSGPPARITNVLLQTQCPYDIVGHLGVPTDPVAVQWVENALARNGPADPAFQPSC